MAYTGAASGRDNAVAQEDVIERDGIHALHLTPEAGTMKNGRSARVPLHEHLVAQGFLEFALSRPNGPLFYEPSKKAKSDDPAGVSKSRASQVRQRLAAWVRSLGVRDRAVSAKPRMAAYVQTDCRPCRNFGADVRRHNGTFAPRTLERSYGAPDARGQGGRDEEVSQIRPRMNTTVKSGARSGQDQQEICDGQITEQEEARA